MRSQRATPSAGPIRPRTVRSIVLGSGPGGEGGGVAGESSGSVSRDLRVRPELQTARPGETHRSAGRHRRERRPRGEVRPAGSDRPESEDFVR
jgi:hypothetical protein